MESLCIYGLVISLAIFVDDWCGSCKCLTGDEPIFRHMTRCGTVSQGYEPLLE
jgi:hypothetical protein